MYTTLQKQWLRIHMVLAAVEAKIMNEQDAIDLVEATLKDDDLTTRAMSVLELELPSEGAITEELAAVYYVAQKYTQEENNDDFKRAYEEGEALYPGPDYDGNYPPCYPA